MEILKVKVALVIADIYYYHLSNYYGILVILEDV